MNLSRRNIQKAYAAARKALFDARSTDGSWEGELTASALSAATAVAALSMVSRERHAPVIDGGLAWLARHCNKDGGWGDTPDSPSNLSTTWLSCAAFRIAGRSREHGDVVRRGDDWVRRNAGLSGPERVRALEAVYGKDRTFASPILMMCALAGDVEWSAPAPLPYELAWVPARFYSALRLRVVSYALPALIAIGQLLHAKRPTRNPLMRWLRGASIEPTLRKLERIQPSTGGFLEAIPLTSFVVMSLAANGRPQHPVAEKGVRFLLGSARPDGGWPIEVNLRTWLTSQAVCALSHEGWNDHAAREYLLRSQCGGVHPYTHAEPGGWAWNDLPGGVPDVDDTSGALLALRALGTEDISAARRGVGWLLGLQNRDGGWPTFCRGWGKLPFDRSAPDLTAHAVRALAAWPGVSEPKVAKSIERGFAYLRRAQQADGSWLPLWFGNQHSPGKKNPVYGTARVLRAYCECDRKDSPEARRGVDFLRGAQNSDGSWGGAPGIAGSVEETALSLDALSDCVYNNVNASTWELGLKWLTEQVGLGGLSNPVPIGLYFEQLWYAEKLYPAIWSVSALERALKFVGEHPAQPSEPVGFRGERI